MRIGRHAIVSFPNFGHWRVRLRCCCTGDADNALLGYAWYDTPNIHLCTISDFLALSRELGIVIERSLTLDRAGQAFSLDPIGNLANLLAEQAVFLLRSNHGD